MQSFCLHNIPQGLLYDILSRIQKRVHPFSSLYHSPQSNYSPTGCQSKPVQAFLALHYNNSAKHDSNLTCHSTPPDGGSLKLQSKCRCSYCSYKRCAHFQAWIVACTIARVYYHGQNGKPHGWLCQKLNKKGNSNVIKNRQQGTVAWG